MRIESPLLTERLKLDLLDPSRIAPEYLAWINDPNINRFLEIRFHTQTAADLAEFVGTTNDSSNNLLLGIFLRACGRHVGNVKLGPILWEHLRADMGIVIGDSSVWGKGYATEAIEALTQYAFGNLRLHRITAGMYTGNIGSHKAFLNAGYTEDGRLRDYWLSNGEWQDEIVLGRISGLARD